MNGTVVFSDEQLNIVYLKFNCPNSASYHSSRETLMRHAVEYTDDYVISRVDVGNRGDWIKNDTRKSDHRDRFPTIGDSIGINFTAKSSIYGPQYEICAVFDAPLAPPAPKEFPLADIIGPMLEVYVHQNLSRKSSIPEILKIICEHERYRFNPGCRSYHGTALKHACSRNMPEVALALIATGKSNPGAQDEFGDTALIWACKNNMTDVALALIATGESHPEARSKLGDTALIWVCKNNMPKVAHALIATGKSHPEAQNNVNSTALIWACYANMPEVALALIATGESHPEIQNDNKNTALIWACKNKMTDVAHALIATGESNFKALDISGDNAIMHARNNKLTDVIKALEALEAPVPAPALEAPAPAPTVDEEEERINAEVERRFKEFLEKKELARKAFDAEVEERLAKKLKEAGI